MFLSILWKEIKIVFFPYNSEYRKNDDCNVSTALKLAKALSVTLDELCITNE